jgi:large subunit ribosomal protein L31
MKTAFHPETTIATVTCSSCGATFATRSTRPSIDVEICSACHPAYTGVERSVGRAGQVARFERRLAAARK